MISQQGTFGLSQGFNTVSQGRCCGDDLNAVLGVLEGDMLVTRSVKLMGGCIVGWTAGGTAGLAIAGGVAA